MASSEEWAWAAGLFDGEGSIVVQTGKGRLRSTQIRLCMGLTDFDLVARFHRIVGCGTVIDMKVPSGQKPGRRWGVANRADVIVTLEALLPWLGERRSVKAREVLEIFIRFPLPSKHTKTHCIRGHERTALTVYRHIMPNGEHHQHCCVCANEQRRARRAAARS